MGQNGMIRSLRIMGHSFWDCNFRKLCSNTWILPTVVTVDNPFLLVMWRMVTQQQHATGSGDWTVR